jgi:N-acetylmuramoyl-L-alanine amidase
MKSGLKKQLFIYMAFLLVLFLISQNNFSGIYAGVFKNNNAVKVVEDQKEPIKSIPEVSKKIIVIDPGHGGLDPGTLKDGLLEKDVTLSIAKKTQIYLEQLGYKVLLTRASDTPSYKPTEVEGSRVRKDLDGRITYAKENNANLFISIHVDSLNSDPGQNGSIVYYYPTLEQSKEYAQSIQNSLNDIKVSNGTRSKNDMRTEDFYVIKNSVMPSILIETGFITNRLDHKLLSEDSFKDELALAIAKGIDNLKLLK